MLAGENGGADRRRRARNVALFVALLALVALFYFVTIARMAG